MNNQKILKECETDKELLDELNNKIYVPTKEVKYARARESIEYFAYHQLGIKLMPHQVKMCREFRKELYGNRISVTSSRQIGKAQPLSCNIMTPKGYIKMGDIKIGDYVIGSDGKSAKVLNIFPQGVMKNYKVTFDDGSYTFCNDEHLWIYHTAYQRHNKDKSWKVDTLRTIMDNYYFEENEDKRISIPVVEPIQFDENKHLIKPYSLGVLLGDGTLSQKSQCLVSSNDIEIINELKKELVDCNIDYKGNYNFRITSKWIHRELRRLNLSGTNSHTKFIPKEYLIDSVNNRIELLKGLMDTDGSIYGNRVMEYATVSKQLAEDVKFLVNSLGGKVVLKERKNKFGPVYRLFIKLQFINPFKLKRKADKWYPIKYSPERILRKIELVGEEEMQCIMVNNENHSYLTDECIVTHNTLCQAVIALWAVTYNMIPTGTTKTTNIGIVSKSEDQAKKVMSDIRDLIIIGDNRISQLTGGKVKNFFTNNIKKGGADNRTELTFKNGKIICLPPTDKARGYSLSLLMIDEAAFIDDDVYYKSIEPTVAKTGGSIILTSTPNGQHGFFFDEFDPFGKLDTHTYNRLWFSYEVIKDVDETMFLKLEEKRTMYFNIGKDKEFRQEYEADFLTDTSAFFESDMVDKGIDNTLSVKDSYNKPCNMGIDFGMVHSNTVVTISTIDEEDNIILLYQKIYPYGDDDHLIDDIEALRKRFNIDKIIPDDCLDWNTEILKFDGNKYLPTKLKDIKKGDYVLSYNFNNEKYEPKQVMDSIDKGIKETNKIYLRNGTSIYATKDHKFYYKHKTYNHKKGYKYYKDINRNSERLIVSKKLPNITKEYPISDELIYIYGIYVAEGSHHVGEGRCFLAQSEYKNEEKYYKIKHILDKLGLTYSETKRRNGFILFSSNEINKKLQSFGTYHYNKKLPDEIYSFSDRQLEILLEGLLDGDGWRTSPKINKDGKRTNIVSGYTSTSKELINQVSWIYRRLGRPVNLYSRLPNNRKYIQYNLSENKNSFFNKEQLKGMSQISFIDKGTEKKHVWDINVDGNHNFVLYESGLLVHNCAEGKFIIDEMNKKGWNIKPMSFRRDKVAKYFAFRAKLYKGKIKYPNIKELITQMKVLQETPLKISTDISKPNGGKDDAIDSFLMSCYFYLDDEVNSKLFDWDEVKKNENEKVLQKRSKIPILYPLKRERLRRVGSEYVRKGI